MKIKLIDLSPFKPSGELYLPSTLRTEVCEMVKTCSYPWVGPKGYLSPSSIATFQKCPHYFLLEKIENCPGKWKKNIKMTAGKGFHKGMEVLYRGIINQEEINNERVLQAVSEEYDRETVGKEEFEEFIKTGEEEFFKEVGSAKDEILSASAEYLAQQIYTGVDSPEAVEEEFIITIDGIPFYGISDLVLSNKIVDFKYTGSAQGVNMRKSSVTSDFQLWIYEIAFNKPGCLHVVVPPPKTSRAKERALVTEINRADSFVWEHNDYLKIIKGMLQDINKGNFEKRGAMMGGCPSCKFYDECGRKMKFRRRNTTPEEIELTQEKEIDNATENVSDTSKCGEQGGVLGTPDISSGENSVS